MYMDEEDLYATSNSLSSSFSHSTSFSSSSWSSSSSSQTKRPTVKELSCGLYRVHWEFSSSTTEDGSYTSPFTIDCFPITLYNSTTFEVSLSRHRITFGFRNTIFLTCNAASTSGSAIPNWLPLEVCLEGGDEHLMRVPPSSKTACSWGISFWETKIKTSIVLHLQFNVNQIVFPSHLYRLLVSQELCDLTFTFSCGRIYKAHRNVLCYGNEYFQTLFRSGVKESAESLIIDDFPYQLFVDGITYLYTGVIPESYCSVGGFESLFQMHVLAQRYSFSNLGSYCLGRLVSQFGFDNVLSLYIRSKDLGLHSLETAALAYISRYASLIWRLPSTTAYVRENPAVFLKVSSDICQYIKSQVTHKCRSV